MKSKLEIVLTEYNHQFHPVIEFDPVTDRLYPFNFSGTGNTIPASQWNDTTEFEAAVMNLLQTNHCRYGIGGYAENRQLYKRSPLFDHQQNKQAVMDESRTLHLGIDIWGRAGEKVFAPLGGMIHGFAFNDQFGDYGATIILQHQLDTIPFYTLYGHLSLADIAHLRRGAYVNRGQTIGHFGQVHENGNWPPHLHFQVIADIEGGEGDYPGVCLPSQKEKYLVNCPDPDIILQLGKYVKR